MADDTLTGAGTGAARSTTTTRTTRVDADDRYRARDVDVNAGVMAATPPGLLRRVSWSAVIAGAVIAFGIQFLLGLLGLAIGAAVLDPANPAGATEWGIGTGLYTVLSQIVSLIAGGFVAARLAGIPRETTALIHGALVWATVSLATFYFVASGATTLIGGLGSAAGTLVRGTGTAVEAVLPDDLSSLPTPDIAMSDLPPEVRQVLQENDVTADELREEVREIYRDVISRGEQRRIGNIAQRTAQDIANTPSDATRDIEDAIDRVFGQGGVISAQEREQLLDSLQERLDLSNREVNRLVDEIEETAQEAQARFDQAVETVQTETAEAAEAAADAVSSIARALFIASVLGLIASIIGGIAGKPEHALVADEVDLTS